MNSYNLSFKADKDLDNITDYTLVTFGEKQTRAYVTGLMLCFQSLAENPEIGRRAEIYAPLLKVFTYKAHSIFYEPTNNGIFIVRILGQRQDLQRHI